MIYSAEGSVIDILIEAVAELDWLCINYVSLKISLNEWIALLLVYQDFEKDWFWYVWIVNKSYNLISIRSKFNILQDFLFL